VAQRDQVGDEHDREHHSGVTNRPSAAVGLMKDDAEQDRDDEGGVAPEPEEG
jgi:hypothetical protein